MSGLKRCWWWLPMWGLVATTVYSAVDTLRDTSQVQDAVIYSWESCNPEVYGEDCRRYNGGGLINMGVGKSGGIAEIRALFALPGWNDTVPDSAELLVYCHVESDTVDRELYLYPVTTQFYEGTESAFWLGNYPDPDSGVTWHHAWLDDGDHDSLNWTTAGGDYTTGVACTTLITGTGAYFSFGHFERILNYWDTSGNDFGFIIINANAVPSSTSKKVIKSSEAGSGYAPLVIMYQSEPAGPRGRRRLMLPSGGSLQ
ncbi:MAG: hypothetical protein ABIE70_13770 [bacterium]